MAELKLGSKLQKGKYEITKVLGSGNFGITYLATTEVAINGQLGQMNATVNVAIKEFYMKDLNNRTSDGFTVEGTQNTMVKNYRNRFKKEAENLAKLHHPNIVKVIEVFDENNTTYYVMEYIEGGSLDDYIKSNGRLPEVEALKCTMEIADALSYMHKNMMIHLDLKPKNIMRNSKGHLFLIDFGLSKQYDENGEPESSTSIGLGTPGYAPLEQASYEQDGTLPVTLDIYALGASLFKMLTGKTPPESSAILNEGFPLSSLQKAGISAYTISVVEKAMASVKKNRYQSVSSLSIAIKNLASNVELTNLDEDESATIYDEEIEVRKVDSQTCQVHITNNDLTLSSVHLSDRIYNLMPEEGEIDINKDYTYQQVLNGEAGRNIVANLRGDSIEITYCFLTNQIDDDSTTHDALAYFDRNKDTIEIPCLGHTINMKKVEGGTFVMGESSVLRRRAFFSDEVPTHHVTISTFYIGETQVTQDLWKTVMGNNPSFHKGTDLPVDSVTWYECQTFISKLIKLTGAIFRLPTEAEWEFAARGGNLSNGYKYSGCKKIAEVAWYGNNSDLKTHPVKTKAPNELGIYDMSGNINEWCNDWYGYDYYKVSVNNNPLGPLTGTHRVQRGGNCFSDAVNCRVTYRTYQKPNLKSYAQSDLNHIVAITTGLRLAISCP